MFVPVQVQLGTPGGSKTLYDRSFELTAKQLAAFGRESENMTVPLTRVGEDLHTQLEAAFASQGATGATGRWTPLSPNYATWKASKRPGLPILVGLRPTRKRTRNSPRKPAQEYTTSGQMMRQLLVPLADRATWHVSPNRLLYAPLSDIAGWHEFGTSKMPARPPVDVGPTFLHSVDRTFVRWIGELTDAAGLSGPGSRG
jgi:hypothetical protein